MSCPIENKSNTIELTVRTSFYLGLRLTLYYWLSVFRECYERSCLVVKIQFSKKGKCLI